MRKTLLAGLTLAVIASTTLAVSPASALTAQEIQGQIKELLAKVADLQAQLKSLGVGIPALEPIRPLTQAAGSSNVEFAPGICRAALARTLQMGERHEEVRELQEFLLSEGYLNAEATGYFGVATEAALKRFQAEQGVTASVNAAGAGTFGPRTRAFLKEWCGESKTRFGASPKAGQAPLSVTFKAMVGGFSMNRFLVDFGDGTSAPISCSAPADACVEPGVVTHLYEKEGTYTAVLWQVPASGSLESADRKALGRIHIRVGGQIACTKEYRPVCASKPVVCITTPCDPVQQTYANKCMAAADGATVLHEGACGDAQGNRPPVVSSFSGPTSLTLNETGTWSIAASDPENGSLSYAVTWGDEWERKSEGRATDASASIVQNTTFTHSYARAGAYRVTVVVTDSAGKQAKASATVQVANTAVACTLEYAPVCGRPIGCANTCPPGQFCAAVCRLHEPVTYGNRCQLQAANAELLYTGECKSAQ